MSPLTAEAPTGAAFFDTNVALYLLSADARKAGIAEDLLAGGGMVSVQVLNEFVSVARRKHGVPWTTVQSVLDTLHRVCTVQPLTVAVQRDAVALAQRLGYAIYDATIIASALDAGCTVLHTEDLQHGQVIRGLRLNNPFV